MDKNELKDVLKQHDLWLRSFRLEGRKAILRCANLQDAILQCANLQDANLDYSCLPLWCGSLSAHFDDRQIIQFIYHATRAGISSKNTSEDIKAELKRLIPLANKFHRVSECGFIEEA